METAPPEERRRALADMPGIAVAAIYVAAIAVVAVPLLVAGTVAAGFVAGLRGGSASEVSASFVDLQYHPLAMAASIALQSCVLLLAAGVVARLAGYPARAAFAWAPAPRLAVAGAVLAGLTAGCLGTWLSTTLADWIPGLSLEHLRRFEQALAAGPLPARLPLLFLIVVPGPLVEELVFRGFLWHALERSLRPRGAWLLSSLAFALVHFDPLHVLSVLPFGVALGWLRMRSGSLAPAVVAHVLNNALALAWVLVMGPGADVNLPAWVPWVGVTGTLAGCALAATPPARIEFRTVHDAHQG